MNKGFEIIIRGDSGTGKTIASGIIGRALRDAGFDVYLTDDVPPPPHEPEPPLHVGPGSLEESWRSGKGWGQRVDIRVGEVLP